MIYVIEISATIDCTWLTEMTILRSQPGSQWATLEQRNVHEVNFKANMLGAHCCEMKSFSDYEANKAFNRITIYKCETISSSQEIYSIICELNEYDDDDDDDGARVVHDAL